MVSQPANQDGAASSCAPAVQTVDRQARTSQHPCELRCGACPVSAAAQVRAKHDIYNSVYAGCAAGAVLAHSAGPKGMCLGCASFAAFSAVIDKVMEHD